MRKSAGASVANRKVGSMLCEGRSNRQPKKKEGEYKRKERRIGSLTQANERERERLAKGDEENERAEAEGVQPWV